MPGKMLTVIVPKRAGRLLTILVFATLLAGSATATDLRLRINGTPFAMSEFEQFLTARHEKPASLEARKRLFQEFLLWSAAREHR
jgi:hypothetical protein